MLLYLFLIKNQSYIDELLLQMSIDYYVAKNFPIKLERPEYQFDNWAVYYKGICENIECSVINEPSSDLEVLGSILIVSRWNIFTKKNYTYYKGICILKFELIITRLHLNADWCPSLTTSCHCTFFKWEVHSNGIWTGNHYQSSSCFWCHKGNTFIRPLDPRKFTSKRYFSVLIAALLLLAVIQFQKGFLSIDNLLFVIWTINRATRCSSGHKLFGCYTHFLSVFSAKSEVRSMLSIIIPWITIIVGFSAFRLEI